jgi:hypothetical protein
VQYLRTVADAVDIPIMLYNLPVATGVNLAPETVGQLAREVANIRYVKDTSADLAQAGQLIHNHGDVISTFVGWDSLMLASLTEGAAGVMAGTANVMPAQLVSVYRAVCDGELERAQSEWGADLSAHGRAHVRTVRSGDQERPERGRFPRGQSSQAGAGPRRHHGRHDRLPRSRASAAVGVAVGAAPSLSGIGRGAEVVAGAT